MCLYLYTGILSRNGVVPTQTSQRDTLTLVYNAGLNAAPTSQVLSTPQPPLSSSTLSHVNAPVFAKRLSISASMKVNHER